jgi:CheY-like chemotaxis protein
MASILIADCDEAVLQELARRFEDLGHCVTTAQSGAEVHGAPVIYDLMIIDFELDGCTGDFIAKTARRRCQTRQVIFFSRYTVYGKLGPSVLKPDVDQLLRVATSVLDAARDTK